MHRKIAGRMANLVSLILGLAIALAGFLIQPVQADSESPAPVCSGQSCSITFEYSGTPYLWVPPGGATDITFDLYGAQGGQGALSLTAGGLGGRISGKLAATPTELYIHVGGAGSRGAGAPSGFNGGGYAGSGHGDEGSGGGATDLRISSGLADRIAVAGGGGGAGGFNWSNAGLGGEGGGLVGGDGGWGQAEPGSGASQSSGGAMGRSNGGNASESGGLGIGGKGASSFFSGGGGGGGGYFGGGGGGSDTDSCCFNGGGGGGGSSYAKPGSTLEVQNTSGVRAGNGVAYISYVLVPQTPTLTPTLTPTPTATPTASPSPSVATLVLPSAEPTVEPTARPTTTPTTTPTATPVQVVEHMPPVVTVTPVVSTPPQTDEQIVDTAAPLKQPSDSSELQEVAPVVVEFVEHVSPPTSTTLSPPIEKIVVVRKVKLVGSEEIASSSASPSSSVIESTSTSTSTRANQNQAPKPSSQQKITTPHLGDWQVPSAALLLVVSGFAVWRKLRRRTPPQFVRIS